VGAAFSYSITATNGPTSFTATGLPGGLSLDASTGLISGAASAPQVATVAISAINSFGSSLPRNLVLTIGSFSAITSATTATGPAGSAFTYSLTASNSPVNFNLTGLPAGLSLNSITGAVTGTPTTEGSYTLTASADNALGAGPPTVLTFAVTDPASGAASLIAPLILAEPASLSATVGSTALFSVTAAGSGTLTYQWALDDIPISGATASTLALAIVNSSDAGAYTVTVTDPTGTSVSAAATLTILSLFVPPSITAQPYYKSTASVGSAMSFTVGASGTEPLSYQWLVGGVPIAGATAETFTLPAVQEADAGTYSVVATNPAGSSTSLGAVLTVTPADVAPIFEYEPSPTSVTVGGTATLIVGVVGPPPITYQWSDGGTAIPGATSTSLTFAPATSAETGTYSVVMTNPAGSVTSSTAALTVDPVGGPPVPVSIVLQPAPASTPVGGLATFTVAVTGDAPITYQWLKNQSPIAGATGPSFTIANAQPSDAGTYEAVAANGFSAGYSFPTPLTVTPQGAPSFLTNVSARGFSGAAAQTLTIGFVVEGTGTESTLVRAVGPSLAQFGVTGFLADPQLTVSNSSNVVVASNDGWGGTAALSAAFAQTGAFPLPAASLDAAVLASLPPGGYTAQVQGANGGTGVVLLEAYDADTAAAATAHCVNMSVRGQTGSGSSVLTVGFVITGPSSMTVLIRGIGPGLAGFSVSGALADPQLTVFDSKNDAVASNDSWGGTAALQAAFAAVSAFALPATSKDSAVLVTLLPGSYTAQVSSASGSTGIALLELYEMP
jgi:hypothetical protein